MAGAAVIGMPWSLVVLQGALLVSGLWLAGAEAPWPSQAILGASAGAVLLGTFAAWRGWVSVFKGAMAAAALGAVASPFATHWAASGSFRLDTDQALPAWLVMAAAVLSARWGPGGLRFRKGWRALALTWGCLGVLIWLSAAYGSNQAGRFHAGLLFCLALLLLCKRWFRMSWAATQAVNTLLLLVIGLPVADRFVRPAHRLDAMPDSRKRLYSYAAAGRDPSALAEWWDYFLAEWNKAAKEICMPDPDHVMPWRLRPNSHCVLFQSVISINSQGFRGAEIPREKGEAYRIVALGESTTFGFTLDRGQRPWPELLEAMIRERLRPGRPVQVINAGIPGCDLTDNLHRLPQDILPLEPDLIVSYHGANGFRLIDRSILRAYGPAPPAYQARPLTLLGDCEYRAKLLFYRHRQRASVPAPASPPNPMGSRYAQAYRRLAHIAKANHIGLVLANYSMAVNARSDPRVIEFYRLRFPGVFSAIHANEVHSRIVRQMAAEDPEICAVDTQPQLDGAHDKFIDLVHFTGEGDEQCAEAIFAGIRGMVEKALGGPEPRASRHGRGGFARAQPPGEGVFPK